MSNVLAVYRHYGCFNANGRGEKKKKEIKRERRRLEIEIRETNNGKLNGYTCKSAGILN